MKMKGLLKEDDKYDSVRAAMKYDMPKYKTGKKIRITHTGRNGWEFPAVMTSNPEIVDTSKEKSFWDQHKIIAAKCKYKDSSDPTDKKEYKAYIVWNGLRDYWETTHDLVPKLIKAIKKQLGAL